MESDTPDMAKLEPAHEGHLPIWSEGNVYFNGAEAFRAEINGKVDAEHTVDANLEELKDGWRLQTDLYDYLGDTACRIIDSDILGKAFEPEERFENPDGSPITFDTDYFGNCRDESVIPGPFAPLKKEIFFR